MRIKLQKWIPSQICLPLHRYLKIVTAVDLCSFCRDIIQKMTMGPLNGGSRFSKVMTIGPLNGGCCISEVLLT